MQNFQSEGRLPAPATRYVILFLIIALTVVFAVPGQIWALSAGFTNSVVSATERDLERCRALKGKPKQNCVGDALSRMASRLSARPDYRGAANTIRQAARAVRAARTVRRAIRAIDSARRKLLRASGKLLTEQKKLARVLSKAKSILRA